MASARRGADAVVLGLALVLNVSRAMGASPAYTITNLGLLPGGFNQSEATGINNSGQITGWCKTSGSSVHPFIYSGGKMTDLGTLGVGDNTQATAINSAGTIVGGGELGGGNPSRGFYYSNGAMTPVGTLGGSFSALTSINTPGVMAGFAETSSAEFHVVTYAGGTFTDLGTMGASSPTAAGINDDGQVLFDGSYAGGNLGSGIYSGGNVTMLGSLGGPQTDGAAINNSGEVVGWSTTQLGGGHVAFSYVNGKMNNLGTLTGTMSEALAINNNGEIVGDSGFKAFVDIDGTMKDLNTMLPIGSGWTLTVATGVNDLGQIVGYGVSPTQQTEAFLLTPVPEPSCVGLLVMGSGIVLSRRVRRAQ